MNRIFSIASALLWLAFACTPASKREPASPETEKPVEYSTVTIDFSQEEYPNQAEVVSVERDGLTVSFSNALWYDNGSAVRAYSNSTVTVSSAREIVSVEFTFGKADGDNEITADIGTFTSPLWEGSAGKIVFSVGGASGHRRISAIKAVLSSKDAPADETPQEPTPSQPGGITPGEDVLDVAFTGVRSGGKYYRWEAPIKGTASSALYDGDTANYQDQAIQLNSKYESYGITTTASGGRLAKVTVEWNGNTYEGSPRSLLVYGRNEPYDSPSDLYSDATSGTLLGEIVYKQGTELSVTGNYTHLGLRSSDGAIYLNKIIILWE